MVIYEASISDKNEHSIAQIKYDIGQGTKKYEMVFNDHTGASNYIDFERKCALQIRLERFINNIQWLSMADDKYINGKTKLLSLYNCQKLKESYDPYNKTTAMTYQEILSSKHDLLNILPPRNHVHFEKLNSDLHEILLFCDSTLF